MNKQILRDQHGKKQVSDEVHMHRLEEYKDQKGQTSIQFTQIFSNKQYLQNKISYGPLGSLSQIHPKVYCFSRKDLF